MIEMPKEELGGTKVGRLALSYAIKEANAGAREEGGNNSGQWVTKYLNGKAPVGSSWCSAFVSWCYFKAAWDLKHPGFPYQVAAKGLWNWMKRRGFTKSRISVPQPGDIIFFWRVSVDDWRGHVGLVHHYENNKIYTIEGNRSPRVEMFEYSIKTRELAGGLREFNDEEMKKLIGYGQLPDFPENHLLSNNPA